MPRAEAIAAQDWPGAAATMLWLAEWQRRHGDYEGAERHYALVAGRWPASREAVSARRGAAGAAVDAHAWDHAEALVAALPHADQTDRLTQAELRKLIHRGRWRARLYVAAWLALVLAFLGLAGSFVQASLARAAVVREATDRGALRRAGRAGDRDRVVHRTSRDRTGGDAISLVGLALAWLSGATLEVAGGRMRAVLQVALCVLGVVALGYIALTHDGLIDLLVETVRFGPDV